MVNLKEMKFVEMPARDRDPVVAMREKIVERLREQAQLLANPNHVRVTLRWKGKGEEKARVRAAPEDAAVLEAAPRRPLRARGLLRRDPAGVPAGANRASPSSPATNSPTPSRRSSGWPATARSTTWSRRRWRANPRPRRSPPGRRVAPPEPSDPRNHLAPILFGRRSWHDAT
jgi:hypothetical protein